MHISVQQENERRLGEALITNQRRAIRESSDQLSACVLHLDALIQLVAVAGSLLYGAHQEQLLAALRRCLPVMPAPHPDAPPVAQAVVAIFNRYGGPGHGPSQVNAATNAIACLLNDLLFSTLFQHDEEAAYKAAMEIRLEIDRVFRAHTKCEAEANAHN